MTKNTIALILPYFGKWPEWIDLYFYSCEQNKDIDFYFFTDCEVPEKYAGNLYFEKMSFAGYCKKISEKLQIDFQPKSAYKLCGVKPFYGYIHEDLLQNYDFLGFGDIDVVWGNIRKFYTDKMLNKYDVFSTHADRVSGHLAIIRNTNYYRELCFKIKDWQEALKDEKAIPLDEVEFSDLLYPASKYIRKFYGKIIRKLFNWRNAWVIYYHIMPFLNFLFGTKRRKLYFKEQHTTPILGGLPLFHDSLEWLYKDGDVINCSNKKEYIYLHFMIFKKNIFRSEYFWHENYYHLDKDFDDVKIDTKGFAKN